MADIHSSERVIVNGFEPVTRDDIDTTTNVTYQQAEAMGAIFRAIGRMTDDRDIKALCEHGAQQADLQACDLDVLREKAEKAGLHASGVQYVDSRYTKPTSMYQGARHD
ncbi:hypothetical protein R20233_01453 [Ralstonia sp. LMG 32965]|uniref:hypothetical protein n=1 Tax=Ralstonia flatus TaxID=3058601 RepID=UPI0028F68EEB|nr:hypothetical protein [Ralstonia sp. LMG 32965]CAJ0867889.1 hypothetical protein R20233_01453 [Ralstonia sp. LMG 32965]